MKGRLSIGVIGCGSISDVYLANLSKRADSVLLAACADREIGRARLKAERYGIRAVRVDELLADSGIDIVMNLTVPLAHAEISAAALEAGKHVYSEKPLATDRIAAARLLDLARARGLRVGGAPDTFMGGGIATCRRLIEAGAIGEIVGGTANTLSPGPESWHPSPAAFYGKGGGPALDMGPYYVTALVELLGPVSGVSALARSIAPERVVGSGPRKGDRFAVEARTHAAALLRFASGAIVGLTTSFDVQASRTPAMELWGTEGSLAVPNPNAYGGTVSLRRKGRPEWEEIEVAPSWDGNMRGIGVVDMAESIARGIPHRASGALCLHVLDVLEAIGDAAANRTERDIMSSPTQV
jgi:predicted dehydrogenase